MTAAALVLGFVGGAWHLAVTWLRAVAVGRGAVRWVVPTIAVGGLGPVAALLAVIHVAPGAAWAVPVGLILARCALLAPLARRIGGVPSRA